MTTTTKERVLGAVTWFLPRRFHTVTCPGCGTPGVCNGIECDHDELCSPDCAG